MSVGLMLTRRPKVRGKPVALVVSNFKSAWVRLIVSDFSVSRRFGVSNVTVKKFASRDEALVLFPHAVTVTVPLVRAVRLAGWLTAWLRNGSRSCCMLTVD